MATKDNNPSLLSKMAMFVRNPTKDWSELDKSEPEQESGYSKRALKEMIERKRQNDFVRRREFDQLRKMRRTGLSISPELAGRPSFFQSSIASNPDERAVTLKKIDEIEAQMSQQWWKSRQDQTSTPAGDGDPRAAGRPPPATDGAPLSAPHRDKAGHFAPTQASDLSPEAGSTQMDLPAPAGAARAATQVPTMSSGSVGGRRVDVESIGFTSSKLFASEMGGDGLADSDMEEAAIRFANGDDAGAEAGLLAALQADHVHPDSADRWASALFDLYRATGQQASFDRVAIEFAERFGHSAPAWFSTPDLLGRKTATTGQDKVATPASDRKIIWEAPAELDLPALQALQTKLSRASAPWHLSWSRLDTITPEAAQALAGLFATWCLQPVQLRFAGADVLERTLRSFTPSGDKGVDPFWWRLRLDALRILRLQDEFELAALDYCVNYEVSPPSWVDARCDYVHDGLNSAWPVGDAYSPPGETVPGDLGDRSQAATALMGLDTIPAAVVELSGEVLGDAAEALDRLQAGLMGVNRLVISCGRLIRVDFSAAGSILNWVAVRESEGCHVQFRDVPPLVATFFDVIGISDHARVVMRTR